MTIYKSIKLILHSLKNQKNLLVLCVILILPTLVACSGNEPVEIDENNDDQLSEAEITPTLESFTEEGKIAFWTTQDGNSEIYLMDADGGNQINLTNNDAHESNPVWSPDGSKIAFLSTRNSNYELAGTYVYEIYIMNADGSDQTRLTNNDMRESHLDWSPDGRKFVFETNWDGIKHEDPYLDWTEIEIAVMDADGSNVIRLTNNDFRDILPAWSPDGSKIAFTSDRDGNHEIYVMDADGSNVIRLTKDGLGNSGPVWSPDGSQIAFGSGRHGQSEICLMDADGKYISCFKIEDPFGHASGPAWSPDGSKIVFSTRGYYGSEIYIMNADGSDALRLVEGIGYRGKPVWQP